MNIDKYTVVTDHVDIDADFGCKEDEFNETVADYIKKGWTVAEVYLEDSTVFVELKKKNWNRE